MMRRRFGHYLIQRETAIPKKGGPKSSLSAEQQLLLDAAAQFRASEAAFHANAGHVVQATATIQKTKSNGNGKGKSG